MGERARVGLLQCGNINDLLVDTYGDYPELFGSLLGGEVELVTFDVQRQRVPDPSECDAWLVSGSASSTYDDLPWIAPVEAMLRKTVDQEVPLVGVCFGHQLLAQALGGRVEKAAGGWAIGTHAYRLVDDPPAWLAGHAGAEVHLIASHQDQVVVLPDGAELLASTPHCPVAGYTLGPTVLAIQPHPEFSSELSRALTDARRHIFGDQLADAALASLGTEIGTDRQLVASWILAVLTGRS